MYSQWHKILPTCFIKRSKAHLKAYLKDLFRICVHSASSGLIMYVTFKQNKIFGSEKNSSHVFKIGCMIYSVNSPSNRSSHQRCSVKKVVRKNSAIFTGKHICWSPFLTKLQAVRAAAILKRDSNTNVFSWILQIFEDHLLWRTYAYDWFWIKHHFPHLLHSGL